MSKASALPINGREREMSRLKEIISELEAKFNSDISEHGIHAGHTDFEEWIDAKTNMAMEVFVIGMTHTSAECEFEGDNLC